MKLQLSYDAKDKIPEGFADLYEERDDVWRFVAIDGLKTQADVDDVKDALAKERDKTREIEKLYAPYKELGQSADDIKALGADNDALKTKLEAALEAAKDKEGEGGGGFDQAKIDKMVDELADQKVKAAVAIETSWRDKKLGELENSLKDLTHEHKELQETNRLGRIENSINAAMQKAKIRPDMIRDMSQMFVGMFDVRDDGSIQTVARQGANVTPGLDPDRFMELQKTERPWLWADNTSANARGSAGSGRWESNPFDPKAPNLTAQGAILAKDRANGTDEARAMQAAVGIPEGQMVLPSGGKGKAA